MIRTNCIINGRMFPLKYQKVFSKDGQAFQGIIFLKHAMGFTYLRRHDKTRLFEPSFCDPKMQEGIMTALEAKDLAQ